MVVDNNEVYAYVDRNDLLEACDNAKQYVVNRIMNEIEKEVKDYYYKRVENIGKEHENRTWFQKVFRIQPDCLKEKFKDKDFEDLYISEMIAFYEEYHKKNGTYVIIDLEEYYNRNKNMIERIRKACLNTKDEKVLVNIETLNYLGEFIPKH